MQLDWLQSYNLITFEEIDSTNSEALRIANSGAVGDSVILSKIQTGGRGTKGRYWDSLAGNLHISILLQTEFDIKKNSQLPFLAANAVFETINYFSQQKGIKLNMKLKWPNDVLIDSKKVAGILLESISLKGKNYIVIGIGVNIEKAPDINKNATCIKDWGIEIPSLDTFLNILMGKFNTLYEQWKSDNNFTKTRKTWMKHAYNLNKVIVVDDGSNKISGVYKGIASDGAMLIQLASGQYCSIVTGELLFLEE